MTLYITQLIDSLDVGGAETLQVTFAEAARAGDIRLTVIALRDVGGSAIAEKVQAFGAQVVMFPARKVYDPKRFWRLASFLRRERGDALHTHLTHANILGAVLGRLIGIPVVATLHSTSIEPRHDHPALRWLETLALRYGVQCIVAVGHQVAEAHRSRLRGKPIEVVPNAVSLPPGISAAERLALRREMIGDPARPLLISVGRLALPKGYPDLLTAFAALRQTHPSAALVIVGEGHLRDELAAQIAALKLEGHAILLGARSDVPRLLAASDLYVSASHWEGLSVAVLEAMAAGLPVIATSVGDVPRVVVSGAGVVVPPKEPAALAEAARALLNDPAQRQSLGAAAKAHVTHNHSPAVWLDRHLRLYQEAAGHAGASLQPA